MVDNQRDGGKPTTDSPSIPTRMPHTNQSAKQRAAEKALHKPEVKLLKPELSRSGLHKFTFIPRHMGSAGSKVPICTDVKGQAKEKIFGNIFYSKHLTVFKEGEDS